MDELDAALGGLRAAGWPAPEDPGGDDDAELDGRDLICDRLLDEVGRLRQCAGWLTHLHTKGFPSAVNLRPEGDHRERAHVVAGLPRVAAILNRIAADVDELARARRVADLDAAAVLGDRRAERRRQAAEPDLDFREFCRRSKLPQSERSWDLEEVLDDRVIANPFDTSRFLTQDPAEMNHGVSVVPAGSLRIPALAQPQDQPSGLWPQRCVLPPHVKQPVPECFVHLHLQGS